MTCKHTDAGCNSPQSECAGLCTGMKFYPRPIPMPIQYAEPELHIDYAGDEPIRWIQAAAGYVALLFLVIACVAFAAGYFSK